MERALANSRQGLAYGAQETGVVTTSGNFRPATGTSYNPENWAMTLHGSSDVHETREIVIDVEAADRQNQDGQPRFFKQLPSGDYLPSLLTIAHSIPAAREGMLMRSCVQSSYGQDSDWWRGHAIRMPRIVNTHDGSPVNPTQSEDEDIVNEVQRLMAFLDASNRSYGCIDNLTAIATDRARREGWGSETVMDRTLRGWETAACALQGGPRDLTGLFHSTIGSTDPTDKSRQDLWSILLSVSEADRRRPGDLTLADIMDNAIWDPDLPEADMHDIVMQRCADILAMRVVQDGSTLDKLGLVVPSSLFVDKYLADNIAVSRDIRKAIGATRQRLTQLEELHQNLSNIPQNSGAGSLDALDMLQTTREQLRGATRDAVVADYEARGIELPDGALESSDAEAAANEAMAKQLDDLWSKINSKLKTLEDEKQKAQEMLSKLAQTNPQLPEGVEPKHQYTLRGVSTKPNVTYILRPKTLNIITDSMDISSDAAAPEPENDPLADPDAPPGWMWWRIEFDSTHSPGRIMKTESTQDDVLRAVELEHSSALLVYASDQAMNWPSDPKLPEALAEFVATDNKLFREELDGHGNSSGMTSYGAGQVWSTVYNAGTVEQRSRAGSQGSTMVNYDDGEDSGHGVIEAQEMDEAPPYTIHDPSPWDYEDAKIKGSPDAHEIHLEDTQENGAVESIESVKVMTDASHRSSVTMTGQSDREGAV